LVEDADGEVLGRIEARTSIPIVAPFRRDIQTALRKQILDVAIAEREADVEPNGVPDNRRRELVAGK
jgi:hypothetical protein